tara:strand:- start:652 stop:891 length:240 start_codon:yes stop_codon:yes gene_type:complete
MERRIPSRRYRYGFGKRAFRFRVSRRHVVVDAALFRVQRRFVTIVVVVTIGRHSIVSSSSSFLSSSSSSSSSFWKTRLL